MKIVVDCRYIRWDRHDGISRYTAGIVAELSKIHPVTMLISDRRQLDTLPHAPWQLINPPTNVWEPFVALRVNRLRPDVVFSPMQTMGSFGRRYKLLLTLHDLIYYRHRTPPCELPIAVRLLWRLYHAAMWPQRLILNRADAVVTVSHTTKALIARHALTRRPVIVVPNAAGTTPAPHRTTPRPAPAQTLVYMGSFMRYKNVDALVRAAELLPDYELHLMSCITHTERQRLKTLAPSSRLVFHNGVTDYEYIQILSNATALVTASHDEGFGIPLVEAMNVGTPVVVSDIPIFREIAADAAHYVNPDSPADIAKNIRALAAQWPEYSERSFTRAAHYSWERSARTLLRVMTSLTSSAKPGANGSECP